MRLILSVISIVFLVVLAQGYSLNNRHEHIDQTHAPRVDRSASNETESNEKLSRQIAQDEAEEVEENAVEKEKRQSKTSQELDIEPHELLRRFTENNETDDEVTEDVVAEEEDTEDEEMKEEVNEEVKEGHMANNKKFPKSSQKESPGKRQRRHNPHRFHAGMNTAAGSTDMQSGTTENYWI